MVTSFSWLQLLGGLGWFWLLLGVAYLSTRWPRWNLVTVLLFLAAPIATLISWAFDPPRADRVLGETTIGFVLFWLAFAILFVGASMGWFVFGVWKRAYALSFESQKSTNNLLPVDDLFSSVTTDVSSSLMLLPFLIGGLIGRLIGVDEKAVTKRGVYRTGTLLFLVTNAVMFAGYVLVCLLAMPLV